MIHLTLCGPYAGRPLCDCDRETAKQKGDTFHHYQLAPYSLLTSPELCSVCRATVETMDDNEETTERAIAVARRAMEEGQTLPLDL